MKLGFEFIKCMFVVEILEYYNLYVFTKYVRLVLHSWLTVFFFSTGDCAQIKAFMRMDFSSVNATNTVSIISRTLISHPEMDYVSSKLNSLFEWEEN